MRITALSALTALLMAAFAPHAEAESNETPSECRRFDRSAAKPTDFAPRLARLCVRLVDAHDSADGLSGEEMAAATLLGEYLAVVGELDLRKGAAGIGPRPGRARAGTSETARYLIAHRMGLLAAADRLAPKSPQTAELR